MVSHSHLICQDTPEYVCEGGVVGVSVWVGMSVWVGEAA